jgi:hypothetical protein
VPPGVPPPPGPPEQPDPDPPEDEDDEDEDAATQVAEALIRRASTFFAETPDAFVASLSLNLSVIRLLDGVGALGFTFGGEFVLIPGQGWDFYIQNGGGVFLPAGSGVALEAGFVWDLPNHQSYTGGFGGIGGAIPGWSLDVFGGGMGGPSGFKTGPYWGSPGATFVNQLYWYRWGQHRRKP